MLSITEMLSVFSREVRVYQTIQYSISWGKIVSNAWLFLTDDPDSQTRTCTHRETQYTCTVLYECTYAGSLPGKGCRCTNCSGSPRLSPNKRTSSLWNSASGSTTLPCSSVCMHHRLCRRCVHAPQTDCVYSLIASAL